VADAEVVAIIKALELIQGLLTSLPNIERVYIFSDSQAAIQKVENGYSYYAY
jgi:ribonuclease HI